MSAWQWYLQEIGDGIRIDCIVCVQLYNLREQFVFGRKVVEQQVRGGFERELPRWCCRRFCTGAITGREGGWRRTLGRLYSQHWGLLNRPNNEKHSSYEYLQLPKLCLNRDRDYRQPAIRLRLHLCRILSDRFLPSKAICCKCAYGFSLFVYPRFRDCMYTVALLMCPSLQGRRG